MHHEHNNHHECKCSNKPAQVESPAPLFDLEACEGSGEHFTRVKLSALKGKWVILFFYPLDFTFICPTEITGFNSRFDEFTKLNAVIVGASTDSVHSHKAWINGTLGKLKYPIMADMTREVSRAYGVLLENAGTALRGAFIIDPDGILKYSVISDDNVGRNVDEILRVLEALQTGERCPVNWKPGEATLGKA